MAEFDTSALQPEDLQLAPGQGVSGEILVKAEAFPRLKLMRVVPLDAHARETYGEPGWTEDFFASDFRTGDKLPTERGALKGWKYQGTAKDEPSEWQKEYAKRVRNFAKKSGRSNGVYGVGESARSLIEREAGESDDHIILGTIKPDLTIRTVDVPLRLDAFHGTDAVFDRFEFTNDIGFHFGSAETANARLNQMSGEGTPGEGANVRPVTLDIKNPLRMPDLHDWDPADVASSLVDLGIISQEQADAAQIVDQDQVQAWLGAHGYDSIVYANETEGTGDSYIVFDPALIHPRFGSSKG